MATEEVNIETYHKLDTDFRMKTLLASRTPLCSTKEDKVRVLDSFIKQIKDESSEIGMTCKEFVNAGFQLNMQTETRHTLVLVLSIIHDSSRFEEIKARFEASALADELMAMYSPDTDSAEKVSVSQNEGNALVEIQHLKHLMDIMERNIQGKMTEQDAIELKENGGNWSKDIKKLKQMVGTLND